MVRHTGPHCRRDQEGNDLPWRDRHTGVLDLCWHRCVLTIPKNLDLGKKNRYKCLKSATTDLSNDLLSSPRVTDDSKCLTQPTLEVR